MHLEACLMRVLVVYESMFGNTRAIAEAVVAGLSGATDVALVPVRDVTLEQVQAADILVVGGPTHAHGMSSSQSRKGAPDYVDKFDVPLVLEPGWDGPGLRDWFATLPEGHGRGAAFDTRADINHLLSGRASRGIADRLRHHGYRLIADPESFLVDRQNQLLPEELVRAKEWGTSLLEAAALV
jgi:hypothetical protein